MWPALALANLNLPEPVFLNLLAAARLVFILGIVRFSCLHKRCVKSNRQGSFRLAASQMQMAQAVNITARAMRKQTIDATALFSVNLYSERSFSWL
jgi:hypothetical protein